MITMTRMTMEIIAGSSGMRIFSRRIYARISKRFISRATRRARLQPAKAHKVSL
jgi:hypothetical protein